MVATGLGALPFSRRKKPPAHQDDLALTVVAPAHHRRHVPGKDGVDGFEGGATVVGHAEEAPDVISLGVRE
jgi:hypothetical protein